MGIIANLGAMGIVAVIIAIVATVLAFIFIVPEKRRAQMGAFGKFLHDTCNFKYLIVEKILQALYIFATAYGHSGRLLHALHGPAGLFTAPAIARRLWPADHDRRPHCRAGWSRSC